MNQRKRPLVLGHRGASADAPDNSLEAFHLAVDLGADGVELDVRFTADRQVVLHHDPGLHDIGVFAHTPFDEIRAGAPGVPTLDEAADVLADLMINIEIKNDPREPDHDPAHAMADAMVEWITARQANDRTIVSSFNPQTVARVHELDASVTTGQLLDPLADVVGQIPVIAERGHRWVLPYRRHLERHGRVLVDTARSHGLSVGVWTVDAPRRLRALAELRVDAVITNDPRRALAVYAETG